MKPVQHILIVYEVIPEEVRLFLVPDDTLSTQELALVLAAHGGYMSSTDLDLKSKQAKGIDCISAAIEPVREYAEEGYPKLVGTPWIQRFLSYEVGKFPTGEVKEGPALEPKTISHIVRTGFML